MAAQLSEIPHLELSRQPLNEGKLIFCTRRFPSKSLQPAERCVSLNVNCQSLPSSSNKNYTSVRDVAGNAGDVGKAEKQQQKKQAKDRKAVEGKQYKTAKERGGEGGEMVSRG